MTTLAALGLVLVTVISSFGLANAMSDRGAPRAVTRWIVSIAGGLAYLMAVVWLDVWTAIALSAACLLLVAALRVGRATLLRGLRPPSGESSRAELGYPAVATLALSVGWAVFGDAWLGFVVIAFMAWGDASAGLIRGLMADSRYQAPAATATMLAVSVACACLVYWSMAGIAAAIVASVAEGLWPLTGSRISDNWPVVCSGLGVLIVLRGN